MSASGITSTPIKSPLAINNLRFKNLPAVVEQVVKKKRSAWIISAASLRLNAEFDILLTQPPGGDADQDLPTATPELGTWKIAITGCTKGVSVVGVRGCLDDLRKGDLMRATIDIDKDFNATLHFIVFKKGDPDVCKYPDSLEAI